MPAYFSISEDVTKTQAKEIAEAFGAGDVIVCHPICATRPGRATMKQALKRAGLAPELAERCGWGTAAPSKLIEAGDIIEAPPSQVAMPEFVPTEPEPAPDPPTSRPRSKRTGRRSKRDDPAG